MDKILNYITRTSFNKEIKISGSKSESNRLLILQQFYSNLIIENLGNANDVAILQDALKHLKSEKNIGHAGTAMRFLTAYFSTISKETILTGSKRMQKRPMKILVDALRILGVKITYLNKDGFPPIKIKGTNIIKDTIKMDGFVSSQYISALLLIAPSLKNGLTIELIGKVTSKPYIKMTLSLLEEIGIKTTWLANKIKVFPKIEIKDKTIIVESDWSSVSYFYSLVALSKKSKLKISYFKKESLQGDKALVEIYKQFGVKTTFVEDSIIIEKQEGFKQKKHVTFNLIETPDIAQTIAVTCFGLRVSCDLTGLHTLKIKETDRLEALKIELKKLGAKVRITEDSFHLKNEKPKTKDNKIFCIETYKDHRMAMAFAPLSLLMPLTIKDAEVINKSYPDFWCDFEKILNPK